MGIDPNNDVLQLLKKLKEANGAYPDDLLAVRRIGYLKQVTAVSGGAGVAVALKNTAKSGTASGLPPAAGMLLEGLLVVAIVAEASAVTYFYRNKLTEFFQNFSNRPKVEQGSNPPVFSSPIPDFELTNSPVATGTMVVTQTATPESTPSLLAAQPTEQGSGGSGTGTGGQAVSTPVPNDNNGNHYGQTPIPERTKESGNNNNPDSQSDE